MIPSKCIYNLTCLINLIFIINLNSPLAQAEGIRELWHDDVVRENLASEVGKNWWLQDTNQIVTNIPGKIEWKSACQWDSPGVNYMNRSIIQVGGRQVDPTEMKYTSTPGMGNKKETLIYTKALQTGAEMLGFQGSTIRLGFNLRGSYDRCPTHVPPSTTDKSISTIREIFMITASCNSNQDGVSKNITLWNAAPYREWAVTESNPFDILNYLDIDTSTCNGPLFVTFKMPPQERLTLDVLEITLSSIN